MSTLIIVKWKWWINFQILFLNERRMMESREVTKIHQTESLRITNKKIEFRVGAFLIVDCLSVFCAPLPDRGRWGRGSLCLTKLSHAPPHRRRLALLLTFLNPLRERHSCAAVLPPDISCLVAFSLLPDYNILLSNFNISYTYLLY